MIETQCRCGAIQLAIEGDPLAQVICHCDDCQAAHGAAYRLSAVYHADQVKITEGEPEMTAVKSTPRLHCAACATPLFAETGNERLRLRSLNAYLLPQGRFAAQFHIHCADAVLPIVDDLPHYKRMPAMWGGTDELVGW